MGLQFNRGTTVTLFANFLTAAGSEPATVTDPKITIRHIDSSGVLQTDISESAMTLAAETLYYYQWSIPADAEQAVYTVEYEAYIDGNYAESTQEVNVFALGTFPGAVTGCDYTTKEMVAALIEGVDASDISDDWINWASSYINAYTCRSFCSQNHVQYYDIENYHTDTLFCKHFPVISVSEILNDGTLIDSADYLVYEDEGIIKLKDYYDLTILTQPYFTRGRKKVKVTYQYGYSSVPQDIVYAASLIAARITMQSLGVSTSNVTEKQIGDTRIRYAGNGAGRNSNLQMSIADIQKNILDRYKRKDNLGV